MADSKAIHDVLKSYFGFESFKGNQQAAIEALLDGRDVFVLMPTGGGKSLCYQLPALCSEGTAIVISPLIALMKNQVDAMRNFSENEGIAHFLNSSLNRAAIEQVRCDVLAGRTKLLYVAPESLTKEDNIRFLRSARISFFAVDEAHCISEWGHDFRPEYRRIRSIINKIGTRPVIALTATATPKVQHDIQRNLGMVDPAIFKSSFNRPNLFYEVRPKTRETDADIVRFIKHNPGKSGIIYCLSRKRVEELAEVLAINNIAALPYHAGMDAQTRSENQDAFLQEKINVIVATIAFGMGIDKPDVRYVIHYDIPKSLEGYYQETGRAGRDGGEGICITYYSAKDLQKLDKLMQSKSSSEREIGRQLLVETAAYAESSLCRRRILLHYFGEKYSEVNCGCCDNCVHPKESVEATEELLCLLQTVADIKENYRMEYVVNMLIGRRTDEIKAGGNDRLEIFGSCRARDEKFLSALIQQSVIAGYLCRDIENYGILRLTPMGREFLKHPGSFKIVEDSEFPDVDADTASRSAAGGAVDEVLFKMLRSLRKDMAAKRNLPPYMIFQDPSLEAMATIYPLTEEELLSIPGVGQGKARRFGKEFLELIGRHVEENEIERPEDYRVRQVADKSSVRSYIVQGIDRRIDLEVLAEGRCIEFSEMLDEIESIVDSGVRLNLDYYINTFLDDDMKQEVEDYFRSTPDDDINQAIEDFADDFSEEEVRLLRIKFISEFGN